MAADAPRTYRGCLVTPARRNGSGMRWVAFVPDAVRGGGFVRADTLAGVRQLIRWAQGDPATGTTTTGTTGTGTGTRSRHCHVHHVCTDHTAPYGAAWELPCTC